MINVNLMSPMRKSCEKSAANVKQDPVVDCNRKRRKPSNLLPIRELVSVSVELRVNRQEQLQMNAVLNDHVFNWHMGQF